MQEAPRKAPETKLEPRQTSVCETSETFEREREREREKSFIDNQEVIFESAARDTEEREID